MGSSFGGVTFASSSAVTITNASTLYVDAPAAAGANTTITNPWAFFVNSGNAYFGGSIGIGTTSPNDLLDVNGAIGLTSTTSTLPTNGIYLSLRKMRRATGRLHSCHESARNGCSDAYIMLTFHNILVESVENYSLLVPVWMVFKPRCPFPAFGHPMLRA
jgi:hypothetical protein